MSLDSIDIYNFFPIQPPKEYQIFDNATLKINSNTFECKDCTIQIANISRVFVKGLPKEKYSVWHLIFIIIGLLILIIPDFEEISFLGFVCIAFVGLLIFRIYQYNKDTQNGLQIEMNSGGISFLISKDLNFLKKAADTISNTINEFGKQGSINNFYEVDFKNAQIKGVVAIGSNTGEIHNE